MNVQPLTLHTMFNQVIGDGANLFIVIIAVAIGFVAALGFVDSQRQEKKDEGHRPK